ncbi:unnamed protein product [Schistosoma curassoni]|uniref:Uncharacterized protein n=1 Tax=Schistosoma curassoni TaxID=6186 RepID=A0A183JTU5_9TREM|nr:unnamed protein product [Schistosoma curassoni]
MSLLALARKKKDGGCTSNTSTDKEEYASVVRTVTRCVKHPTVKSPLKLTGIEAPLDIDTGSHASLVKIDGPDKTITVPNSPGVAVLTDEKWTAVRRKRNEEKNAVGITHLVGMSLVNSHSESRNALPNSNSKTEHHSSVTEKNLLSSSIVESNFLESNSPDPKIRHAHDLEKLVELWSTMTLVLL